MSNIRLLGDPAIATAMLATMQSIHAVRSAPSGISEPRWRILQCIAKAAPNVPTPGELRMCSGLNKAALAEHVQALQWKGLLEMGGYRLSPSAAEMVGIAQPYPPKDAKAMVIAPDQGVVIVPQDVQIIGLDLSSQPDVTVKVTGRYRRDGGMDIETIEFDPPMDPADVPACMRPDCMPPVDPIPSPKRRREANTHGRGSAAVARPRTGAVLSDRVATDRITEVVAGSNPAPGQPATLTPELVTSLRAAIPPRRSPAPVDAPKQSARVVSGDAWEMQVRRGSEELLRALRRYHPERCGEA